MTFWKSWNWPQYCRECLLYLLHWHRVIETSSLTVTKLKSSSQYYPLWMWRQVGTRHWGGLTVPTNHEKSHVSGSPIQNTVITGHSPQHRMNGPLWTTSCKHWGHSDFGPCGCQRGIQSHCIMLSQSTMTCFIIWMALCELWLIKAINGRKTCSSPWN